MKKKPAVPRSGRLVQGIVTFLGLLVIFFGAIVYLSTRPVDVELAQDPNPLEAHFAQGKLDLLKEACENKKKGFIRLSEVEINSILETKYNDPKNIRTNLPVALVKTAVLLHQTNLTFVSWHKASLVGGLSVSFVWQRTVSPVPERGGTSIRMDAMRLGRINVPKEVWPKIEQFFGKTDVVFADRRDWIASLPKVAVTKNELSLAPELRFFSYDPDEAPAPEKPAQ